MLCTCFSLLFCASCACERKSESQSVSAHSWPGKWPVANVPMHSFAHGYHPLRRQPRREARLDFGLGVRHVIGGLSCKSLRCTGEYMYTA